MTENGMRLTLDIPFDDGPVGLHVDAHGRSAMDPIPLLQKAVRAIEAEMAAFYKCPIHKKKGLAGKPNL